MTNQSQEQPENTSSLTYIFNYEGAVTTQVIAERTAEIQASFFLPLLKPGISLLDCGCGPGSITLGLAKAVAPGEVVGVDFGESQIETARSSASEQGVTNARFEIADTYDLPFPDNTFDAIFCHAVMGHLTEPMKAVKEMYRVTKPNGIVGVRNLMWDTLIMSPSNDILDAFWDLRRRVQVHTGKDPLIGTKMRQILREAGFTKTLGSATCQSRVTIERTRQYANIVASFQDDIKEIAIQMGWTDEETVEETKVALKQWGEHPDAMTALIWFEAIGFKE